MPHIMVNNVQLYYELHGAGSLVRSEIGFLEKVGFAAGYPSPWPDHRSSRGGKGGVHDRSIARTTKRAFAGFSPIRRML